MHYDFTADARDVRALLSDTADIYLHSRSRAPDEHPQVTRVELAMLPGDGTIAPALYVDFDVRPEPEPDGDADFRCIGEPHRLGWMALFKSTDGLTASFPDGSVHTAPGAAGASTATTPTTSSSPASSFTASPPPTPTASSIASPTAAR